MRPQHITAENLTRVVRLIVRVAASMRPQHITAENPPDVRPAWGVRTSLQ